ncbi:hypothetical protein ACFZBU_35940 [Embleya sp. NPDC008237]|uniref:hypothetical protein n=1 Tax=Embleya sp. NPDC008237 TaxID=3363978 RepID=UPI0036E860B1
MQAPTDIDTGCTPARDRHPRFEAGNARPDTGLAGGTSYGHCGNEWWGYDTPAGLAVKTKWAREQQLGGAFFRELSGDTENGELAAALDRGLG